MIDISKQMLTATDGGLSIIKSVIGSFELDKLNSNGTTSYQVNKQGNNYCVVIEEEEILNPIEFVQWHRGFSQIDAYAYICYNCNLDLFDLIEKTLKDSTNNGFKLLEHYVIICSADNKWSEAEVVDSDFVTDTITISHPDQASMECKGLLSFVSNAKRIDISEAIGLIVSDLTYIHLGIMNELFFSEKGRS